MQQRPVAQKWYEGENQAKKYENFQYEYMSSIRHICLQLANRRSNLVPKRILDIGCGTGGDIPSLENIFPEADITGIDIELAMLDIATKKIFHKPVTFVQSGIEKLPETIGVFDFLFSFSSFRLWKNPILCLQNIQSHISKNGMAYIVDLRRDIPGKTLDMALSLAKGSEKLVLEQITSAYKFSEIISLLGESKIMNYSVYERPLNVLFRSKNQRNGIREENAKLFDHTYSKNKYILEDLLIHLFIYPKNYE